MLNLFKETMKTVKLTSVADLSTQKSKPRSQIRSPYIFTPTSRLYVHVIKKTNISVRSLVSRHFEGWYHFRAMSSYILFMSYYYV